MANQTLYSGVKFAGEIVLKSLYLVNAEGKRKTDIMYLMTEMDIYEDIFSNTLSASITMVENFNMITGYPIVGEEVVEVEFYSEALPEASRTFKKTFFVYKVSNRVTTNDKKNVYVLQLVSQELLIDTNTKISRAFSGYSNDIVQTIYDANFKEFGTPLVIGDTSSNYVKFVSNYWSPLKSINYASSRATAKDAFKTPTFLFFETGKSFKFTSLNALYSKPATMEYFYDADPKRIRAANGETTKDVAREFQTAESMDIEYTVDFLDRMMTGVYGHRMFEFDILKKSFNYNSYSYYNDFGKTNHLEKYPMCSFALANNASIGRNVTMPFVHNQFKLDQSSDIIMKRLSLLAQTEMYKVDLVVPGRPDLEVGDVVQFNMLDYASADPSEAGKGIDKRDKYYSGNYLVAAIMHRVTQTRHKMHLQLIKESFVNQIVVGEEM